MENEPHVTQPKSRSRRVRIAQIFVGLLLIWLVAAYLIVPFVWKGYARHDPTFDDNPRVTHTGDHHPGDPLNVALIGTEAQLEAQMKLAKWYPATTLGLESDLKIAADTVLSARMRRPQSVASTYLGGKRIWRSNNRWATIHGIGTTSGSGRPTP